MHSALQRLISEQAAVFPEVSARNDGFLRNNVVENPYIYI